MNLLVIVVVLGGIIFLCSFNVARAFQCPNCYKDYKWNDKKRYFALMWQDVRQRSICKHCAWTSEVKEWQPPKHSVLKAMQYISPIDKILNKKKKKNQNKT